MMSVSIRTRFGFAGRKRYFSNTPSSVYTTDSALHGASVDAMVGQMNTGFLRSRQLLLRYQNFASADTDNQITAFFFHDSNQTVDLTLTALAVEIIKTTLQSLPAKLSSIIVPIRL